ncbi:hypothetical protein AAHZ94_33230, partial [Streptomyces sp. HSW2009]
MNAGARRGGGGVARATGLVCLVLFLVGAGAALATGAEQVAALLPTAPGLLLSLLAYRKSRAESAVQQLDHALGASAADRLAREVRTEWEEEAAARGLDEQALTLRWTWSPREVGAPRELVLRRRLVA